MKYGRDSEFESGDGYGYGVGKSDGRGNVEGFGIGFGIGGDCFSTWYNPYNSMGFGNGVEYDPISDDRYLFTT